MMMKQISNKNIKAFSERFGYRRKGRNSLVPISNEQARQAIDNFVTLNGDNNLKPSFVEKRLRLLKICLEEETASKRWTKVRDFLLENLESQVLSVSITQSDLSNDEVKPSHIMSYLMDSNSSLCQCIKTAVLFNITDVNEILPDEVLIDFGSGIEYSFPEHTIKHQVIILKAITINGVIIERVIPANDDNLSNMFGDVLKSKFVSKYSFLSDQDSNIHEIQGDKFFNYISKGYPEFIRAYKLNSSMKPSFLLNAFKQEVQQKILKEFASSKILTWKWVVENKTAIDISKVVKEYFSDVNDKIISIRHNYPIKWEPDNYLFDEDSLRSELVDLFLKRFQPHEREVLLLEHIEHLSIFNLKTFRNVVEKWGQDKDIAKIILMLQTLLSHYSVYKKDSKERNKMIQYVKITRLINNGTRRMVAYKIVSPGEIENTVEQRYLRKRNQLRKSGYEIDSPDHISLLMKEWDISEFELLNYQN